MKVGQRRYSHEQDAAVIHAQLDQGVPATRVVELAAAGELAMPGTDETLPAFVMPVTTARDKAGDARRERKTREIATHGAGEELAELVGILIVVARKEVERVRRASSRGPVKHAELRGAAAAVREVLALQRMLERGPAASAKPPADTNGSGDAPADDWLDRLAAAG